MQVERSCLEEVFGWNLGGLSGGRVSNAWITCLIQGDNGEKFPLTPHKTTAPHGAGVKYL